MKADPITMPNANLVERNEQCHSVGRCHAHRSRGYSASNTQDYYSNPQMKTITPTVLSYTARLPFRAGLLPSQRPLKLHL